MELGIVVVFMVLVILVKGLTSLRVSNLQASIRNAEKEEVETRRKREAIEAKENHLGKENRLLARQERMLEGEKEALCAEIREMGGEPVPENELDAIDAVGHVTSGAGVERAPVDPGAEAGEAAETRDGAERPVAEDASGPEAGNARFRILLVDDNEDLRHVMQKALNRHYEVVVSPDALDALVKIVKEKQKFDLVITDLQMPNLNGFNLMEHIPDDIPVVVISGFLEVPGYQETLGRLKPVAALEKPFKFGEVRRIIEGMAKEGYPAMVQASVN